MTVSKTFSEPRGLPEPRGLSRPLRLMFHDFGQAARQAGVLLLPALPVFGFLLPFSTAGLPGSSIFNIDHTHQQLKYRFFLPELSPAASAAAVIFGLALGMALFGFLLKKESAAAYFSLPLSRTELFLTRWAAGFLFALAGIGLPLTLSLGLNLAALGTASVLPGLPDFFFLLSGFLLLAMVSFTLTALCCCLSGTGLEALLFTAALLSFFSVLTLGVGALMKKLLWGNAFGALTYSGVTEIAPNLTALAAPFNPLLFFLRPGAESAIFYRGLTESAPRVPRWTLAGAWTLALLALLALALAAVRRRRVEQAGISGCAPSVLPALTGFVLCFASAAAVFSYMADFGPGFAAVLSGVVLALVYGLTAAPLFARRFLSGAFIRGFLLQAGLVSGLALVVAAGGLGYSGRVPEAAQVARAEFSYAGSPSYLAEAVSGSASGRGYYFMSQYPYTDPADIAEVLRLHRRFADAGFAPLGGNADFRRTVLPYDIEIRYRLHSGRELVRYYDRASLDLLTDMLRLDDSVYAREAVSAVLTGQTGDGGKPAGTAAPCFAGGQIYVSDNWYKNPSLLELSPEERTALLAALAADLRRQSVQDRYFPETPPLAILMFTLDGGNDGRWFAYKISNAPVFLTEGFRETLAFLRAKGLFSPEGPEQTGPAVESLSLLAYDPYDGINKRESPLSNYFIAYQSPRPDHFLVERDFGRKRRITDEAALARILPALQNGYFMNDGGWLAEIKLVGKEEYVYKYLPAKAAEGI